MSVTYTINALFGAKVIAGDTGFFLNDEMDDFTTKPARAEHVRPGAGREQRHRAGQAAAVLDEPDDRHQRRQALHGARQPRRPAHHHDQLETIINVVDYGMNVQEAVDAPRIHHQWLPDQIFLEPMALSADTRAILEGRGHKLVDGNPWGGVAAIVALPGEGEADGVILYGGSDARELAGAAVAE